MAWCTFWFCIILNIGWVHVCLLLFHDIISLLFFSQSDWVEFSHGACWSYASPVSNRFLFKFLFRNSNHLVSPCTHTHTLTKPFESLICWVLGPGLERFSAMCQFFWQVKCMAAARGTWFSEGRLHGELPVVSICNNRWSAFLYAAWAQRCPVFERNKINILIFVDQSFIECSNMSSASYWPDESVTRFIHTKWQPTFCAPSCERRGSLSMFSKANHFDAV